MRSTPDRACTPTIERLTLRNFSVDIIEALRDFCLSRKNIMTSILSSGLLEVAIGLAFVYLLLSLFCSIVNEWIAGITGSRAYNLEKGIRSLFTDGKLNNAISLKDALYDHGLIQSLYQSGFWDKVFLRRGGPSYIPSPIFATTLVNLLLPNPGVTDTSVDSLRTAINNLPESKARQALLALVNQGQTDLESVRRSLEAWYNDGMERVAGWYKRRTTLVLLCLGMIVAVAVNADSFLIARTLWTNPALRQATVTAADKYVQDYKPDNATGTPPTTEQVKQSLDNLNSQLAGLQLPLGWPSKGSNNDPRSFPDQDKTAWFRIFGWFFTAAALSLGAPFWFDLLNKFMLARSAVKPKDKSQTDESKG